MKTSFLEYYKIILHKVSFDRSLFVKEYGKATRRLQRHEVRHLDAWLQSRDLYQFLSEASDVETRSAA